MKLPSLSTLKRVMACPGSAVLPQTADTGSVAADRGNAVHEFLRCHVVGDEAGKGLVLAGPYANDCKKVNLSGLRSLSESKCEVAMAYDPFKNTARVLGYNINREYEKHGRLPHEYAGTADIIGRTDSLWLLADYKTGSASYVEPAGENWQLIGLCVAWALCPESGNPSEIKAAIIRTKGNIPLYDTAIFDSFDLDLAASSMRRLAEKILAGTQELNAGDHCTYCPARPNCPLMRDV